MFPISKYISDLGINRTQNVQIINHLFPTFCAKKIVLFVIMVLVAAVKNAPKDMGGLKFIF